MDECHLRDQTFKGYGDVRERAGTGVSRQHESMVMPSHA